MGLPSWLTKDFMEGVLRQNCNDPEITVHNFDVRATTTKGENYASVIHRVAVSYQDEKGSYTKNFIVKSLPESELMQSYLKDRRVFDKEISAYSKLIPAMRSLSELPLVFPRYYATDRADTVILEDLTSRGFKMADRQKRLDLDHSCLVLKALARFHGLSFAVVQIDPTIIDLFSETTTSDSKLNENQEKFELIFYKDLISFIETWPGYEKFAERILRRKDVIKKQVNECLLPKDGAFNVLNHGDCWVNNMLFRYSEERKNVEDVCLIDLQALRHSSPATDIQYFLTSSLADGIRNEHEDMLLEVYHKELIVTLKSVGVDSIIYSLDDLKKDYDEKAPFGFQVGMFVLGAVAVDPSEAFEIDDLSGDWSEDSSASPFFKTFRGEGYKHVFQQHLLYYEGKGII